MKIYFLSIPNLAINPELNYRTIGEVDTMNFLIPVLEKLNLSIDRFKFYGSIGYDDQFVQFLSESENEVKYIAELLDAEMEKVMNLNPSEKFDRYKDVYEEFVQISFSESMEDFEDGEMEGLSWK
jgi:hypothetical protein